jgi:transcription factor TFIIIB component B''
MRLTRVRQAEAGSKRQRKKKDEGKNQKKRGETPEGAENEIIDRSEMTMAELCKDLKIGEKSSRHEQMKKQMNAAKLKAKEVRLAKKRAAARASGGEGAESAADVEGEEENSQTAAAHTSPEPEEARAGGIRYMVVDGNLVLDPRSVEVRREESATRKGGKKDWVKEIKEIRQENEFSTIVTSGSYMKREPAQLWNYAATELFWKALAMFGPNFEMMAKMFPSRNRRQIKLKYQTEERDNEWRIRKIEREPKIPIDWDLFQEHCSEELVDVEEIEAELQAYADEEARMEEVMRKERLAVDEQKRATIRKSGSTASRRALDNMLDEEGGDGNNQSQPSRPREASAAPKGKKKAAPSKRMKKNMGQQDPDNYTVVARMD